ncbi:hypothetical protein A946_03540 [Methylacidiphilum kamchatkense Kam1]|uniref:Uncharacterized protein n=1 Tax=Methylacidiphilum kamchatkense Kam1 TaxID=1202785 RepID=A0A0C1US07_9BACT|nr:hypothetical protein [Methylacidiphilum kamchatkense]KIE59104.1 hypothetical protein A946_03540 [Methylacidiphilum kamchatkense Kam1]QDQ42980.1 hypothetical protein kam1_1766 [Methylacidiphilum kamchatkense Kam1]
MDNNYKSFDHKNSFDRSTSHLKREWDYISLSIVLAIIIGYVLFVIFLNFDHFIPYLRPESEIFDIPPTPF